MCVHMLEMVILSMDNQLAYTQMLFTEQKLKYGLQMQSLAN